MTSPLRRKRRITVRGRTTLTWTTVNLFGLGLLLTGGAVQAQQPPTPPTNPYGTWRPAEAAAPAVATVRGAVPAVPAAAPSPTILSYYKEAEPPPAPVQRTSAQFPSAYPSGSGASATADDFENPIPVGLKEGGPNQVVRFESEANFKRRLIQKERQKPSPTGTTFPDEPVISTMAYVERGFPGHTLLVEPNYVSYGPLWFQERNAERYGWDLGILQPPLQAGIFFADVVMLPYHLGASLCHGPECSAGQCLPGDPVPYRLYPPNLSLAGGVLEVGAIAGALAVFP
jgi:hypothetical protein